MSSTHILSLLDQKEHFEYKNLSERSLEPIISEKWLKNNVFNPYIILIGSKEHFEYKNFYERFLEPKLQLSKHSFQLGWR